MFRNDWHVVLLCFLTSLPTLIKKAFFNKMPFFYLIPNFKQKNLKLNKNDKENGSRVNHYSDVTNQCCGDECH